MGVSTMSDYNRNIASPFGQVAAPASSVAVDEGLRAYMLRVYNYMVLGLAITGLTALGIYMLSVTGDAAAAAKIVRNGLEIPARVGGNMYLTQLGVTLFVSPLKWVVILAPLGFVLLFSFRIQRMAPATAQLLYWAFAACMGLSLSTIFLAYTRISQLAISKRNVSLLTRTIHNQCAGLFSEVDQIQQLGNRKIS